MVTSNLKPGERVKYVSFSEDALQVDLVDGRSIVVPLAWYPRLLHALPEHLCGLTVEARFQDFQ